MSVELVPKEKLPDWGADDEQLKKEFEDRLNNGKLRLVSAAKP